MASIDVEIKVQGSNWTLEYTDHLISWETFARRTLSLLHPKESITPTIFRSRVNHDIEIYWPLSICLILWTRLYPKKKIFEKKKSKVKLDIGIYWPLNILRTLYLTDIKFDTQLHPKESITHIDYEVKG
jgi:hypothetical protein